MSIYSELVKRLPPYKHGAVWVCGDTIMCKTEDVADAIADIVEALSDEEEQCCTGYYDPAEDARSGEVDELTGWYYVDC